jgi:hypothetical protein
MPPAIVPDACDPSALAVVRLSKTSPHSVGGTFTYNGIANTIYRTPPGVCVGQMLNGKGDLFSDERTTSEAAASYIGMMRYTTGADDIATIVRFKKNVLDGLRDCAIAAMCREVKARTEAGTAISMLWRGAEYVDVAHRLLDAYGTSNTNERLTAKARLDSPPPKVDATGAAISPGSAQDHVNDGDTVAFEIIPKLAVMIPAQKWYITFTLVGIHVLARNTNEMDVARAKMAHERRCARVRVGAAEDIERERRREEQRAEGRARAERAAAERAAAERAARDAEERARLLRSAPDPPAPVSMPVGNPEGVPRTTCTICATEPVNCIYQCGHACACLGCTRVLHEDPRPLCPMCRAPILVVTPIYLAGYNEDAGIAPAAAEDSRE